MSKQTIQDWFAEQVQEHLAHGETDMPEIGRKVAAAIPGNRLRDFAEWAGPQMARQVNNSLSTVSGEAQREATQAGLVRRRKSFGLGLYTLSLLNRGSVLHVDATSAQLREHAQVLMDHGKATLAKANHWLSEADEMDAQGFRTYGELLASRRAA